MKSNWGESGVYGKSKIAFHKDKLKDLSVGKISAPIYVRVKPTNRCDHRCFYCSYAPGSDCPVSETINLGDEIPHEKMLEILSDFRDMGVKAVTFSGGGEPLVYPHILEALKKTVEYGIELSMITNGQKLNREKAEALSKAEWVRISLDTSDEETFSKSRRVPKAFFSELVKNIKNFAEIKKKGCEFGINFVVHELNHNQVFQSAKFFKELGVNHIKITPRYTPNFLEYHSLTKDSVLKQIAKARAELSDDNFAVYDTYENDFSMGGLPERNYPKCNVMQIVPVIGADSVVYFCHDKTYSKNGVLGSIKDKSFKDLWFSKEVEDKFNNFNPKEGCRHHCTYDLANINIQKMINDLDNLDKYLPASDRHKNFI